jgi:hypothetical protein
MQKINAYGRLDLEKLQILTIYIYQTSKNNKL